ncbi:MAG: AAA family ATPase [Lachnospiraceae bacterium]|nr:AAA family ATPase [Lachnospiraceae bacterium]
MSSILQKTNMNKIFLIYGHLDDMFISRNLQKNNFRPFLNGYLKSIGYDQVVFYSGAKNVGKFVLDDESAVLAINKNKRQQDATSNTNASTIEQPKKKRRIMNPRAAANKTDEQSNSDSNVQQSEQIQTTNDTPNTETTKLVYKQPKITPIEFLEDAKKMMADNTHKSAIVFTFFQDFFTDRAAPLQPYLELVSHLWDEYSNESNDNICIFLAPQMSNTDLSKMFDNMENGFVLKNRFFNSNGTVNRGTAIEVGLPNLDELSYMLEYLRIVGDKGKRLVFKQEEKKKITSSIMYLSRESEKDEKRSGYLHAIYNNIVNYMVMQPELDVEINEDVVKKLYSKYKKVDDADPLEKLKNTSGWESVASRIEEILKDYRMKKAEAERNGIQRNQIVKPACSNERIDTETDNIGFKYPVPHFVLRGNPGVGKTTVARLIGQIFYNEGILQKGSTIEAKRDDLVGQYVGETAIKTTECVEGALEGVLFIDDAYSLLEKGDDHNYAKEAIDTLVPIMTNPEKYRFCMIMAGYPEPMDDLLEMNAGLRSRFSKANILTIEDYKPELLKKIFVNDCKKAGYKFIGEAEGEEALDLDLFFTNLYNQRNRADFGNARDIVALAKEVKMQCSLRDDSIRCIVKDDFGDFQKYFIKRGVSSIDEIYAQIDKYVGMDFVKDLFKNIRFEVLDTIDSKKRGITPEPYPDHYIFAGNPGTGKTTVGKMIGEFYHMMEVLGGTETLFVDASDIIGNHVGDSKNKIVEVMQQAIDHNQVLYIDEAYQISESAYGNEIIGAMMTKMTENADDFKVIFGMYSNRVEAFLKMNAGLSRRLRVVEFPDYTPDQLLEIFDRTISSQGCTITEEAHERVKLIMEYKYNIRGEDFGNAGEVKKMVIDMKRLRLDRVYSSDEEIDKYEYILEDIPADLLAKVEDRVNPKSLDDIMEELNQQVGMSDLKDIIIQKQEEIIFAQKSGESITNIRPGYYFFVGNPGTGKSTSAKLFAECMQQLGIVKTNNFHSCTAKDLIGQYVGETDKKTYALLQKSINSVLFIDEAYSLSYADSHSDTNYKKEALEQIIAFMDEPEHRRNCCIILAGYEKDMQGLYKSNSGMRSRIEEVHFRDYTADETYDIFKLFCKKNGFSISEGVREIYVPVFEELKKLEYFSNGRTARTIYEKTTMNLKRRIVRSDNIEPGTEKTIIPTDLLSVDEAIAVIGVDGK